MVGLSTNRLQQQRATGDRIAVMVRIGQTHEEVPPVEDQRDNACHDPAARQVVGGISAPAPMLQQLGEAIITMSPLPATRPNCKTLILPRGHKNRTFRDYRS